MLFLQMSNIKLGFNITLMGFVNFVTTLCWWQSPDDFKIKKQHSIINIFIHFNEFWFTLKPLSSADGHLECVNVDL